MMRQKATATRARSCTAKQRYYSRWRAFLAAESATRRTGHAHDYYHCRFCRHYHIGHVDTEGS